MPYGNSSLALRQNRIPRTPRPRASNSRVSHSPSRGRNCLRVHTHSRCRRRPTSGTRTAPPTDNPSRSSTGRTNTRRGHQPGPHSGSNVRPLRWCIGSPKSSRWPFRFRTVGCPAQDRARRGSTKASPDGRWESPCHPPTLFPLRGRPAGRTTHHRSRRRPRRRCTSHSRIEGDDRRRRSHRDTLML